MFQCSQNGGDRGDRFQLGSVTSHCQKSERTCNVCVSSMKVALFFFPFFFFKRSHSSPPPPLSLCRNLFRVSFWSLEDFINEMK